MKITFCLFSGELEDVAAGLEKLCSENEIKLVANPDDITAEKFDLLISFSYQKKLFANTINKAALAVNFHPAPLPDYKGRAPAIWALINGEKEFGATCHFIDTGIDTGKIIECRKFPIGTIKTGRELSEKAWYVCLEELNVFMNRYLKGDVITGVQQEHTGEYYSMAKLQAAKKIELTENIEDINRKINALWYPPFEGAYIELNGERLYLINKDILEGLS